MIIECPSCHTKFSVDDSQVTDIDDPRFHCCRCGNYFRPSDAEDSATATQSSEDTQQVSEETQQDSVSATSAAQENEGDWSPEIEAGEEELLQDKAKAHVEQLDLLPAEEEDQSLGFPSSPAEKKPASEREPLVTAEWLDESAASSPRVQEVDYTGTVIGGSGVRGIDIRRSDSSQYGVGDSTKQFAATQGAAVSGADAGRDDTARRETGVRDTSRSGKVAQLLAQARRREDVEREVQSQRIEHTPTTHSMPSPPLATMVSSESQESEESEASTFKAQERDRRSAKRRSSKHQRWISEMERKNSSSSGGKAGLRQMRFNFSPNQAPVLFLCSVPLLIVLALCYSTAYFDRIPDILSSTFHLDSRHIPKIPPKGLDLVGLSSNVVTLDNGKQVLEVRGEVLHGTERSFKQVTIEARLFDSANRQIRTLNVNPLNELQEAKLAALDEKTIETLQTRSLTGKDTLVPNSRSPFRLVFPIVNGEEKWFSARVYTVFPA